MKHRLLLAFPFLAACQAGPQTPVERARVMFPGVRAMVTAAEVVAVDRKAITPEQGDAILAGLQAVQDALDAGTGDWETILALGDRALGLLAGTLRPAEIEAALAMLRMLVGLAAPATQPAR